MGSNDIFRKIVLPVNRYTFEKAGIHYDGRYNLENGEVLVRPFKSMDDWQIVGVINEKVCNEAAIPIIEKWVQS